MERKLKYLPTYQSINPIFHFGETMIHRGQMNPSSSSSSSSCCLSSSSSSCFSEKHDSTHLYYHISLWALIKKNGLLCLLGPAGMTNAMHYALSALAHTHVSRPSWPFNSNMFSVRGTLHWEYCRPQWAVRSFQRVSLTSSVSFSK